MLVWLKLVGLPFLKAHFEAIVVVAVVAAYTGFIYHEGAKGPEALLRAERADRAAVAARVAAEEKKQRKESNDLVEELNLKHAEKLAQTEGDWDLYVSILCPGGVAAGGVCLAGVGADAREPIRVAAGVCDDAAGRDRLSDALSRYRDENRAAIGDERAETSRLLKACQKQTDSLIDAQEYAAREKAIHLR